MKWRVGDWAEVDCWESKIGWYKVTGYITEKDHEEATLYITTISKSLENIKTNHHPGKESTFKQYKLEISTMFDAKQNFYELLRDSALIFNRKDKFMEYSGMIELMKD